MSANDIAEACGYNSAVDMIIDNSTEEELKDMLREYLHNDSDLFDLVSEIAYENFDYRYIDPDEGKETYDEWRDRQIDAYYDSKEE